jgi:hypothetical protein
MKNAFWCVILVLVVWGLIRAFGFADVPGQPFVPAKIQEQASPLIAPRAEASPRAGSLVPVREVQPLPEESVEGEVIAVVEEAVREEPLVEEVPAEEVPVIELPDEPVDPVVEPEESVEEVQPLPPEVLPVPENACAPAVSVCEPARAAETCPKPESAKAAAPVRPRLFRFGWFR